MERIRNGIAKPKDAKRHISSNKRATVKPKKRAKSLE